MKKHKQHTVTAAKDLQSVDLQPADLQPVNLQPVIAAASHCEIAAGTTADYGTVTDTTATSADFTIDEIFEKSGSLMYCINPRTYKLQSAVGKLDQHAPYKAGGVCYEEIWGGIAPCNNCPLWKMKKDCLGFYQNGVQTRNFDAISGEWLDVQSFCKRNGDDPGEQRIVVSCHNITEYVKQFTEHDDLTPAFSYVYFKSHAETICDRNPDKKFGIIHLDLKKFKNVNLTYGYSAGNQVLISLAKIIMEGLSQLEIVARVSGDKFIILKEIKFDTENEIKDIDLDRLALEACRRVVSDTRNELFSALNEKINKTHLKIVAGISVIDDTDNNIDAFIDKASAANTYAVAHLKHAAVYNEELRKRDQTQRRIEMSMENAITQNEFLVYLQPKVYIETNIMCGAEALVRWRQSNGVMIFPDEFIPVFEKNGFIRKLDFYVYETTMKAMRKWLDMGVNLPPISLNVSRAHMNKGNFTAKMYSLTKKYDIPPHLIELELTESMLFNDNENPNNMLEELQSLGFLISVDDFGSGYSSFLLLKDMPVDILKLDKAFFTGKYVKTKDKIIIETVATMAKRLNLKIICEGVETAEQTEYLREIKCDMAQGYYFSRPIPMEEFEKTLF